jgi:hypothetical protein
MAWTRPTRGSASPGRATPTRRRCREMEGCVFSLFFKCLFPQF